MHVRQSCSRSDAPAVCEVAPPPCNRPLQRCSSCTRPASVPPWRPAHDLYRRGRLQAQNAQNISGRFARTRFCGSPPKLGNHRSMGLSKCGRRSTGVSVLVAYLGLRRVAMVASRSGPSSRSGFFRSSDCRQNWGTTVRASPASGAVWGGENPDASRRTTRERRGSGNRRGGQLVMARAHSVRSDHNSLPQAETRIRRGALWDGTASTTIANSPPDPSRCAIRHPPPWRRANFVPLWGGPRKRLPTLVFRVFRNEGVAGRS